MVLQRRHAEVEVQPRHARPQRLPQAQHLGGGGGRGERGLLGCRGAARGSAQGAVMPLGCGTCCPAQSRAPILAPLCAAHLLKPKLALHEDEQPAVAEEEGEAVAGRQVRAQRRVQLRRAGRGRGRGRCRGSRSRARSKERQPYTRVQRRAWLRSREGGGAAGRRAAAEWQAATGRKGRPCSGPPAARGSAAPAAAPAWPCRVGDSRAGGHRQGGIRKEEKRVLHCSRQHHGASGALCQRHYMPNQLPIG